MKHLDDILFLDTARDVYSLIDAGEPMPECFPAAVQAVAEEAWNVCTALQSAEEHCDSPIEVAMLRMMVAEWYGYGNGFALHLRSGETTFLRRKPGGLPELTISLQHQIGRYHADFAVWFGDSATIVVECDGHNYHHKTKEQAAHDSARDRFMTAQGIRVLRFTGSQIYENVKACVVEVRNLITKLVLEARKAAANG